VQHTADDVAAAFLLVRVWVTDRHHVKVAHTCRHCVNGAHVGARAREAQGVLRRELIRVAHPGCNMQVCAEVKPRSGSSCAHAYRDAGAMRATIDKVFHRQKLILAYGHCIELLGGLCGQWLFSYG